MAKAASDSQKASASAVAKPKKRQGVVPKFRDLPVTDQRDRVNAFLDEVGQFWKGKPSTGSVDFLVKLRRGK